jgi:hypothetical protein
MIKVGSVSPRGTFVRRAAPHWTAIRAVPWLLLAFLTVIAWTALGELPAAADEPPFIQIHEGKHWIWYARQDQFKEHAKDIERYYEYADRAFAYLTEAWHVKLPREKYALLVRPVPGGGFAAGDIGEVHQLTGKPAPGIGVSYDAFSNDFDGIKGGWGYVLITHEMVNVFTGEMVPGGWPLDWWANHKSPFPLMTAVQIESALVPAVAIRHAKQQDTPLGRMFLGLKERFGWVLFRRAFAAAKEDGIDWSRFGPNPGALRTNMVCAYLQLGAPEDLTPYLRGLVPDFDGGLVAKIVKARRRWHALPVNDPARAQLRDAYLHWEEPGDPSKTKLFKEKSVWTNENITLTVLRVDGETFEATFVMAGDNIDREIKGTIKDGRVSWLAKDVHAVKGNAGGDNSGTIVTDRIGQKIDFVRRENNGESGRYTLRLSKKK